nr:trefoil factor 2 [Gorilla gorilla gorilla]
MGRRDAQLLAALLVLGLCALAGSEKPSPCQCSRLSPHNRTNCGFPGITSDQCFDNGCCFNSSVTGVPWCFHPLPKQGQASQASLGPTLPQSPGEAVPGDAAPGSKHLMIHRGCKSALLSEEEGVELSSAQQA